MGGRILCLLVLAKWLSAQAVLDPGQQANTWLGEKTGQRLQLLFEARQRAENRTGILFGQDRDISADYVRIRFGIILKPLDWMKVSVVAQDTRAPWYGGAAPANIRDPLDLQQAYVQLFSSSEKGFGLTVGRLMINLGDTRLIGSPQWAYVARTWDTLRLYHVSRRARFELLFLSTGVPRGDRFNKPVFGDRIWGSYNTFEKVLGRHAVDVYFLRHEQNRAGGFTGAGKLGIDMAGTRWALHPTKNLRSTAEVIVQGGHAGERPHRALAFAVLNGYKTTWRSLPLDLAAEYKYASGTRTGSNRSGTFDPLYPGVHDKFGHVDLLGWKNIHNIRSMATLSIRHGWNCVLMYNNSWLASLTDAVYSTGGRAVARSMDGAAGRHIGQEWDLYTNYAWRGIAIGAGVGRFFPGEFIRNTTPGASSRLIYLSTGYSF